MAILSYGECCDQCIKMRAEFASGNKKVTFNVFQALKDPPESESYCQRNTVDKSAIKKNPMKATKHPSEPEKAYKV